MDFFIMKLNKYSKKITQDESLPAAQAMLYGIGLTDNDLKKPQIGIASTGFEGNPCNMHLNDLAKEIKTSVLDENLVGLIFLFFIGSSAPFSASSIKLICSKESSTENENAGICLTWFLIKMAIEFLI